MSKSLNDCASKILSMPYVAWAIVAASVGSLAFAFTMQYGFDIQPCILCLWQRVPFGVAAIFAMVAYFWRPYGMCTLVLLGGCAVAFFVNTGLAFFHTGVERHWWLGTNGCTITPLHGASVQDWKEQLMSMAVGHCDQISWTFLGLSMANWNVLFSLALALFASIAVFRGYKAKS